LKNSNSKLKRELKKYSEGVNSYIPKFDIEEKVYTVRQDETSKLANFAHNLRRSFLRSGNSSKGSIGLNNLFNKFC